jgi:threonylcarbamoyladenosine tRNA methylthiotransferase MtaB
MFERSLAFVEEAGLDLLHVFPFSPRPGTPAARMPQVARPVIRERAARLRAAGKAGLARALGRFVGAEVAALVEKPGLGRSEHYLPVLLPADTSDGEIRAVRVAAASGTALIAEGAR